MNCIKYLILTLAALVALPSNAFIYEMRILQKWDQNTKRYQFFIGLSDFHDKTHSSNTVQLAQIIDWFATLPKDQVRIVVEDLSSANQLGTNSCGRFVVNSRGGILGGLADKGRAMGLEINNVEFRYCRVTSLGPVLNNLKESLDKFPSATTMQIADLVKEIMENVKEIQNYPAIPQLKAHFDKIVLEVLEQLKQLKLDVHESLSISAFLDKYSTPTTRLELLKKLLTFDSGLVDLKMVYSTHMAQNKTKIIAVAGGAHINRACQLLEKSGFKMVKNTKVQFTKEHDLQRCLGSHIVDGAFCVKPEPIQLNFDVVK